MKKYECKTCKTEFESHKKNRKFCSNKCVAEGNRIKEVKLSKICSTCKAEKDRKEFWKRKDAINGLHYECIHCASIRNHNRSPEKKKKEALRCRRKKRIQLGLDPNFEGKFKKRKNVEKWRTTTPTGYV